VEPRIASYVATYAEYRGAGRTKLAEELSAHRRALSEGRRKRARLGGPPTGDPFRDKARYGLRDWRQVQRGIPIDGVASGEEVQQRDVAATRNAVYSVTGILVSAAVIFGAAILILLLAFRS
jgi:hypothetical protein